MSYFTNGERSVSMIRTLQTWKYCSVLFALTQASRDIGSNVHDATLHRHRAGVDDDVVVGRRGCHPRALKVSAAGARTHLCF